MSFFMMRSPLGGSVVDPDGENGPSKAYALILWTGGDKVLLPLMVVKKKRRCREQAGDESPA
jgi:hypothetical protein